MASGGRLPLLIVVNDLVEVVVFTLDDSNDEESRFIFELGERIDLALLDDVHIFVNINAKCL